MRKLKSLRNLPVELITAKVLSNGAIFSKPPTLLSRTSLLHLLLQLFQNLQQVGGLVLCVLSDW